MTRTPKLFLLCGIFLSLLSSAAWSAVPPPVAVSPGNATGVARIGERCPTFLWAGEEGAKSYELVVYRLGEGGAIEPAAAALRVTLPGSAHGWKPSLTQCLEPGGRYAWSLRSLGRRGGSRWSEPALFQIAEQRVETTVEEALSVLRSYIREEGRTNEPARGARPGAGADGTPDRDPVQSPSRPRFGTAQGSLSARAAGDTGRGKLWDDMPEARLPRKASGLATDRARPAAPLSGDTTASLAPAATALVIGDAALSLDGDIHLDASSTIFKDGQTFLHTYGPGWPASRPNTALGMRALGSVTPGIPDEGSGGGNTAMGYGALTNNTSGSANTAIGAEALANNLEGIWNTATGETALLYNTEGQGNTANGFQALVRNTTGSFSTAVGSMALRYTIEANSNTAVGEKALMNSTTANSNTAIGALALKGGVDPSSNPALTGSGNTAAGVAALFYNTTGSGNTASGLLALYYNTEGFRNTATGRVALLRNTTGYRNTGTGNAALWHNTTGFYNTATGNAALNNFTIGTYNTAMGNRAVQGANTGDPDFEPLATGSWNTGVGSHTLRNLTTGERNTALGRRAGYLIATGSDNILIGHEGLATDEANTIRIGTHPGVLTAPTDGEQSRAFIAGVYSQTLGATNHAVCIDSDFQLGDCPESSLRFKQDVRSMGAASAPLFDLRPVTFRFKEGLWGGPDLLQFGLIAEEVAEVLPELVDYDDEGKPVRVHYERLSAMLLNEIQRQQRQIDDLSRELRRARPPDS